MTSSARARLRLPAGGAASYAGRHSPLPTPHSPLVRSVSKLILALCIVFAACATLRPRAGVGDMVAIPGGTYEAGTDSAEVPALLRRYGTTRVELFASELPRRTVTVRAFRLDRTEVTKAAYREFLRARPQWRRENVPATAHDGEYLDGWIGIEPPGDPMAPAASITQESAAAYCSWAGRRLPTEAEWEWAARGGPRAPEYPWGDADPASTRANWHGSHIGHPVRVASYAPNGYGVHDLAGNVWERLADRWPGDTAQGTQARHVIRGGSYGGSPVNLRVRYRDSHRAGDAGDHVGFRCAKDG